MYKKKERKGLMMPAKSHGESKTDLYRKWILMKHDCYNPNSTKYKNLGAQGIKVSPEWDNDFTAFKAYAMENGYKPHLVIDRKDKHKDFEPGNVIFVTRQKRQKNKIVHNPVVYKGEEKSIASWAEEIGISRQALHVRIQKSGSPQRAISEAFASHRKKY